jgi:hypothetical protein
LRYYKADNIDLPSSYQRLRNKITEYQEKGYESLIDWRFGNKLAAKIGKTDEGFNEEVAAKQTALIRKAASMHNNFDTAQIARFVNQIFSKNGWEEVSHGTVYNVIKANEHLITSGARGARTYNNKIAMQVTRKRPDFLFIISRWTAGRLSCFIRMATAIQTAW